MAVSPPLANASSTTTTTLSLFLVLLLSLLLSPAFGEIRTIDTKLAPFAKTANAEVAFLRYGAVTVGDSLYGSEEPSLSFNLRITTIDSPTLPSPEMVLFRDHHVQYIGLDNNKLCCSAEMVKAGECSEAGTLIVSKDVKPTEKSHGDDKFLVDEEENFYYWPHFEEYEGNSTIHVTDTIPLNATGIWYLVLIQCEDTYTVHVKGEFTWRNPTGYLSGVYFSYLPMYVSLVILYLLALIVWFYFVIRFRANMMGLQHTITFVVFVALSESVLEVSDYMDQNSTGGISLYLTVASALVTGAKLTLARTLILLVAIGYSISIPKLELRIKAFIGVLSGLYFLAAASSEYMQVAPQFGIRPGFTYIVATTLILSFTNCVFIAWIGIEMFRTIRQLYAKRLEEKLSLYKWIVGFLIVFILVSVSLFLLEFGLVVIANLKDELWKVWWLFDAYWEYGYFLIALMIAILFRPNENNDRYAYSAIDQYGGEELDGLEDSDSEFGSNSDSIDFGDRDEGYD
eukprot:TRINITY_DN859_c0_g1_i1.p1 TRINITY_DN859_c0_g1~~TRINITY_DN859_c0_g1_i1.p1  ORF type:complete len:535 (+),score=122.39 TRINITY_DN859_c0_g1_i1:69-1607(+)